MKIGIFDPYLDTLSGGERYMLSIASCLSKNHQVDLFWDDKEIINKAKSKFDFSLDSVSVVKNIFNTKTSFLNRLLLSSRYDVIFYLSDGSIPLTAAKKTYLHFQFPTEWVNVTSLTRMKLKQISGVICNSHFTKKLIDKKFNLNSYVIYPPVTLLKQKPFQDKENMILTVGRFSSNGDNDDFKKLYFMIDTFKSLSGNELKDWQFNIVTNFLEKDKDEYEKLKAYADLKNIKLLTNLTRNELLTLYEKAKIYWHAAGFGEDNQLNPEKMEHFGISTVEALSAGCVPIVINSGGQPEIVKEGDNGYLWDSVEELKEKTIKVANWKENNVKVTVNFDALNKKFGNERFCQEINKLIGN